MTSSRLTIVVDRREQRPWRFSGAVDTMPGTLHGGDYSVVGFEDFICIERKSLQDLVGSLTVGRERFIRSLRALSRRRYRAVIVEAQLSQILFGDYRSRATPSSILGSVCAINADFAPVLFCDDAGAAAQLAERQLMKWAQRAYRDRAIAVAEWIDGPLLPAARRDAA